MSEPVLMKGNEACAKGAILAGCRHYFGYPITPQTEISEYMAQELPKVGGVFLQAESEIAAANMVYGASATGFRAMTSSSSPGISLKLETISAMAAGELPGLIVNVSRGGPGIGCIQGSQGDYFQSVKGGGHGDYRVLTLAPKSVQEMMDMTILGFDLADKYRIPALLLSDGVIGQMMEPVVMPEFVEKRPETPWAVSGAMNRAKNVITTLYIDVDGCEVHNQNLQLKYKVIEEQEPRWEDVGLDDAEWVLVAFGFSSRIASTVQQKARAEGLKVGLLRPQTLWPFPHAPIRELAPRVKGFLVIEQNAGQMVEDVRLAVNGRAPVSFYGRAGGALIWPHDIMKTLKDIVINGVNRND